MLLLRISDLSSRDWYSHCISIFMTLCYFNIMLLFIMFLVCSTNILDRVMIDYEYMHMFAKRLAQYSSGLSGRHYVSVVLKYCLPTDAFYTLGPLPVCRASRTRLRRESSSVLDLP